jgi:putative phosphoesterase
VIAILADTHLPKGRRELPLTCLRLLERADAIVHAGDFTALDVLERLGAFAPVHAVRGNVDEWALHTVLPGRLVVELEGLRIGVVHDAGPAAGRHARLRAGFPSCELVVYAHTHWPEIARSGAVWIVNPGSPTERRRAPEHTMIVVHESVPALVSLDP